MGVVNGSSIQALEYYSATKGKHVLTLVDFSSEMLEVGSCKASQLFTHDNFEKYDTEDKHEVSKFLAQGVNGNMVTHGEKEIVDMATILEGRGYLGKTIRSNFWEKVQSRGMPLSLSAIDLRYNKPFEIWNHYNKNDKQPRFIPLFLQCHLQYISIRFSAIHRLDRKLYHCFEEAHNHSSKESLDLDGMSGQGETHVACLREVLTSYFKDFTLEEGSTSRPACPFSNSHDQAAIEERSSSAIFLLPESEAK
ncbi:hypothetical protein TorRG33x02_236440 [Trema orientale]|uniref:Uncharacterized protein n=1 Tax=Trema orientale TaxID=63057 RepID=A0A2P5E0S0_TREOI|nr:hypothetical protein TorRG33x02_236440 [Trema orientale]